MEGNAADHAVPLFFPPFIKGVRKGKSVIPDAPSLPRT